MDKAVIIIIFIIILAFVIYFSRQKLKIIAIGKTGGNDTNDENILNNVESAEFNDLSDLSDLSDFKSDISEERKKLPYRQIAECYILLDEKNKQLVAQDRGHYIMYPGGGIDEGETPEQAAKREVEEETGIILDESTIKVIGEVKWDWMPEWANNEKRKKRYEQFRGEHIYQIIAKIKEVKKPTSDEGDAWKGKISMPITDVINLHERYSDRTHKNIIPYREAQFKVLQKLSC